MSATGTDALWSSHTTCQGLGSPRSAHLASLPSTTRRRVSSDGLPSSMHLTHGSALTKTSTSLTWTASNLAALGRTHCLLLQEFNCVESAHDPPADPAAGDVVDERDSGGPRPAASLPLPPLDKLDTQHAPEDEGTKLPDQRRVTGQIMRNWVQHCRPMRFILFTSHLITRIQQ